MVSSRYLLMAMVVVLPAIYYNREISYLMQMMIKVQAAATTKGAPVTVVSRPVQVPWPEPRADHFDNSTRILWGFWWDGQLPGFCQLALQSWKARNPGWRVVVTSRANYKDFVSVSDLPTTFESLKVQHRSDLVRLAVLIRYGGAYLDLSTVVFKGFDDIWANSSPEQLLLTAPFNLEAGVAVPNNHLLFAPGPGNLVLREWQRRVVEYAEAPCQSYDEMVAHPTFRRVSKLFDDPALGLVAPREIGLYASNLWILADILIFEPTLSSYVAQHVRLLPTLRWTFDSLSFTVLAAAIKSGTYLAGDDVSKDPPVLEWRAPTAIGYLFRLLPMRFRDDPELAESLLQKINIIKVSSDFSVDFREPVEAHLAANSTLGRLYRAAIDTTAWPTAQATLEGVSAVRTMPIL